MRGIFFKVRTSEKMRTEKLAYWLPSVLWMSFIYYLSSGPPPVKSSYLSTIGHLIEYFILACFFSLALSRTTNLNVIQIILIATAMSFAYGVSDEFHQFFISSRVSDINDVLVDIFGAFLGTIGFSAFKTKKQKNQF